MISSSKAYPSNETYQQLTTLPMYFLRPLLQSQKTCMFFSFVGLDLSARAPSIQSSTSGRKGRNSSSPLISLLLTNSGRLPEKSESAQGFSSSMTSMGWWSKRLTMKNAGRAKDQSDIRRVCHVITYSRYTPVGVAGGVQSIQRSIPGVYARSIIYASIQYAMQSVLNYR